MFFHVATGASSSFSITRGLAPRFTKSHFASSLFHSSYLFPFPSLQLLLVVLQSHSPIRTLPLIVCHSKHASFILMWRVFFLNSAFDL